MTLVDLDAKEKLVVTKVTAAGVLDLIGGSWTDAKAIELRRKAAQAAWAADAAWAAELHRMAQVQADKLIELLKAARAARS